MSKDDGITHLLYTTLTHLDNSKGNYVKMLCVDFPSAFNTIVPPNQHQAAGSGAQPIALQVDLQLPVPSPSTLEDCEEGLHLSIIQVIR